MPLITEFKPSAPRLATVAVGADAPVGGHAATPACPTARTGRQPLNHEPHPDPGRQARAGPGPGAAGSLEGDANLA